MKLNHPSSKLCKSFNFKNGIFVHRCLFILILHVFDSVAKRFAIVSMRKVATYEFSLLLCAAAYHDIDCAKRSKIISVVFRIARA